MAIISGEDEDDELILTEDEKMILRLHPKFSVRDTVTNENLEYEQELGYAKVRFDLTKENEESLEDEDSFDTNNKTPTFGQENETREKERIEEMGEEEEARSRQFYDPERNVYDYRKKRVTDIRERPDRWSVDVTVTLWASQTSCQT